jgi:hypothetical protein
MARSSLEIGIDEIMWEVGKVSDPFAVSVTTSLALPFECVMEVTGFWKMTRLP